MDEMSVTEFLDAFPGRAEALSLPDAIVIDSDVDDARILRAFLEGSGWVANPGTSAGPGDPLDPLRVTPAPGVTANFFFGWGVPITFDFDLGEIRDRHALDGLLALLRAVSSVTGKDIAITPEGEDSGPAVVRVIASTGRVVLPGRNGTNPAAGTVTPEPS